MSAEWKRCTVADLAENGEADVLTGPFGTQLRASDYVEAGTPVINVRNVGFGEIRKEKLEYIDDETVRRLSSHLLQEGDIVFGRKGAVERHAFIGDRHSSWLQGSDCIRLRLTSQHVIPRFVSYSFLTEAHQQWMMAQGSHGATMASLNQDIIGRIPLLLPSVEVQDQIVQILSAYDDLIANNTRRIAILEEMAHALYREWFENFRFPGHEQVEMVDSELRPIPAGWRMSSVGEIADVNARSVRSGATPDWINYINISGVNQGRIDEIERMTWDDAPSRARRIVQHGDVIWSTVRPNLRAFSLVLRPEPDTVASTGFVVLSATEVPFSYLYLNTATPEFTDYLVNHTRGSAYPAVNVADFKGAPILLPDKRVLQEFHRLVEPLLQQQKVLTEKNRILHETRNLLLPKLVSGEIDVSSLDEVPEAAVA